METNWTEIKKEIIIETKEILESERDLNINTNDIVDLFFRVIEFPVEEKGINDIQTSMPYGLKKILTEPLLRVEKKTIFKDVGIIEFYLKKVLFLINNNLYKTISKSDKFGLIPVINHLNLNVNNINFNSEIPPYQKTNFVEHLKNAYHARNDIAHNSSEWSNAKIHVDLRSALVIYLYTTYKYQRELKIKINPFDVTSYLETEIEKIKELQSKFVHIEGKEEIVEIDVFARELFGKNKKNENNDEDENKQIIREGTINELRKTIEERKLVILADVGMGKTTTLQYLHLQDAQQALNDSNKPIPIYFELKNLTIKERLVDKLKAKLGIDMDLAEELLKSGRLNLFLDGLNEIEKEMKKSVYIQINNLLDDYPKNFFLFTSRPQYYNRDFNNKLSKREIPVFLLQKMGDIQIVEFLNKNGKEEKEHILNEISKNERLMKIIQTPFMLSMLITVVDIEGKIPNEKGKIIKSFILKLYNTENGFDKKIFHHLLCYLGFQTRDYTESNSGLLRSDINQFLKDGQEELGSQIDQWEFIKKATELNILVDNNNQISFSHELYQEYYAAEYIQQSGKENIVEKYKNSPSWKEIVKIYSDLFIEFEQRILFIKEIAEIDILIAAQCLTSSLQSDINLENAIITKAELILNELVSNDSLDEKALCALIELQKPEKYLPYFQNITENQIPILKPCFQYLLESIRNKSSHILNEIIVYNPSFYLKAVIDFYKSSTDLLEENLFKTFVKKILTDISIKPTSVIGFIKLRPDIDLIVSKDTLDKLFSKISDYNDLVYFGDRFNFHINTMNYLSVKNTDEITLKECHLIFTLISADKYFIEHELITFISTGLRSKNHYFQILSLMLIVYYNQTNHFEKSLVSVHKTILFSKYNYKEFSEIEVFYSTVLKIKQKLQENNLKNNLDSYYGKLINVKVHAKWRYHYLLISKDNIAKSILLPFDEVNELINVGDEITVILSYVDKKNQRLYASQKQIIHKMKQLYFSKTYFDIIKIGDEIECKVEYIREDIKNGIILRPKGISKSSITCKLDNIFKNIELLDPKEWFTVTKVIDGYIAIVVPTKYRQNENA